MGSPAEDLLSAAEEALTKGIVALQRGGAARESHYFEPTVYYLNKHVFPHFASVLEAVNKIINGDFPDSVKLRALEIRHRERLEELSVAVSLINKLTIYIVAEGGREVPLNECDEAFCASLGDKVFDIEGYNQYQIDISHYSSRTLELCQIAMTDNPSIETMFKAAQGYRLLRKYPEGIAAYQRIIEKDPTGSASKQAAQEIEKIKLLQLQSQKLCFIATAAFKDEAAKEVVELRAFRDQVLMRHPWGRHFVRCYYAVSPPVARLIGSYTLLQWLTRNAFIRPLTRLLRVRTKPLRQVAERPDEVSGGGPVGRKCSDPC